MGTTTRTRTVHQCSACGGESPRWLGRCPECDEWGTMTEVGLGSRPHMRVVVGTSTHPDATPRPIVDVDATRSAPRPTAIGELDRVLDGGLVPGSVTLLAGEPGMGKSTLLLQALGRMAQQGARCLLVTAEESCAQVRTRAARVGALAPSLLVVSESSLPRVMAHVEDVAPDVFAVDSIQTVLDPDLPGVPGSVTQVRDCAHRIVQLAKDRVMATVLVGHVTKEGTLAGPRVLEHVVDTVLSFDGDRGAALRLLHALKHRFGGTHELGLFEMAEHGLVDVPDASARFLVDRRAGVAGSAVAAVLEGARPVLVEIQALVVPTRVPTMRPSATGLDAGRVGLMVAVLQQRGGVPIMPAEVYASIAGGIRVSETGGDLAIALALASAQLDRAVSPSTVAIGEVGLGGEIRSVPQLERRLTEAARLGFARAVVPASAEPARSSGIGLVPVRDLGDAIAAGLCPE